MIPNVNSAAIVSGATGTGTSASGLSGLTNGSGNGFSEALSSFVRQTNVDQVEANTAIEQLVDGETDNVQGVVMAVANAEMSFQFFMEMRNKLIDAWTELMRMNF